MNRMGKGIGDERTSGEWVCHHVVAEIVEHELVNHFHRLRILSPEIASKAQPGQFICVFLDDGGRFIMPRPFSISDADEKHIEIAFEVVGSGTAFMANVRCGDALRILGPLGKPFAWLDGNEVALLIGGGMGFAPLPMLAKILREKGVEVMALIGARGIEDLPVKATGKMALKMLGFDLAAMEFAKYGVPSAIALEQLHEGTFFGTVIELTIKWLEANRGRKAVIYACGPRGMLKELQCIMIERSICGQFSVEERMACGLGLCLGCACKVLEDGEERYKMVCVDGPVFDAHKLIL